MAGLLVLLEAEAGAAAQLALLLGKVVGPRGTGPGLQDVVHLGVKGSEVEGFVNAMRRFLCDASSVFG